LYKTRTEPAEKTARTKARDVDVPNLAEFAARASPEDRAEAQQNSAGLERLMDALFPIWPGKRNSWEIARHFALSRRGLDLTEEEWRMIDFPYFVARVREWWKLEVKRKAVWVEHALRALRQPSGRPRGVSVKIIRGLHRHWCEANGVDPKGRIEKACLVDISAGLFLEWEKGDPQKRHAIEERVRLAIKSARKSSR
jgi:hypothetical protein